MDAIEITNGNREWGAARLLGKGVGAMGLAVLLGSCQSPPSQSHLSDWGWTGLMHREMEADKRQEAVVYQSALERFD